LSHSVGRRKRICKQIFDLKQWNGR
jgi:hypothetical protein